MDTDVTMIPEGQYRYAENIRLLTNADGTTGMLQNIEHIRQYVGGIPSDEIILGTATTRLHKEDDNSTVECGIVFTKKTVNTKPYNTLYKVTGFEATNLISEVVVEGYLGIENNVSIVTNYESDKVSNVYICDGLTPIKVINICDVFSDIVIDQTKFDITPGAVLLPFTLKNTINGALPACSIQYCYQLFNLHGPETTTSSLSEVIPITKYDTTGKSSKVIGQTKGELSSRGCQISAKFKNDGRFDRARIFSIIYLDNVSIPDIYIINEVEIPNNKVNEFVEFTYNDTGASFLSKITIDEFNAMVPFEFNAKSIEKKDNRLFASNVQELTWDIDYDARAYRCKWGGEIKLESSYDFQTIEGTLNEDGTITSSNSLIENGKVPQEHDCINPSNTDVLNETQYAYRPKDGGYIRGGVGPNVSYRFTFTEIVPSSADCSQGYMADSLTLDAESFDRYSGIMTYYEDGTECKWNNRITIDPKTGDAVGRAIIPNYADPYICANYLGYQRDEIYRFGVIFYNNKNIPSPVHWIGDIRMPSSNDVTSGQTDSMLYPFHVGRYSRTYNEVKELVAYVLGIEFKLKNIPSDVISYEIVRCDRTEKDRTVVTQGILGALFKFTDWSFGKNDSTGEYGLGENDTRPAPLFNLASNFKTYYMHGDEYNIDQYHTAVPGYFEFVSPEICISKDSILGNIVNNTLCPLYKVNSMFNSRVTIPQEKLHTVSENEEVDNDPDFGKVKSVDGVTYFNAGWGYKHQAYGFAGVFKYYNTSYDSSIKTSLTIEDGIISQILPYFVKLEDTKNYVQFIGNKSYVNTSIGGHRQYSNHGTNAVLQVNESYKPYTNPTGVSDFCTAIIANIKQTTIPYGGNTYISRQNSIYQSCGCFNEDFSSAVVCHGGDTYLSVLDYLNTSIIQESNDADKNHQNRMCCVCYVPLESQINLNLRSDDCYHRQATTGMGPNYVQNEPTSMPNGFVQKKPYYEYNPVYSATSGSKQYIPKSIYFEDNKINQNRIVCSELKTNNEITDSWTKFKFANYLDVDSQYGQITNLKTFKNKLFYWQDSAVGVASVNERSLITDDNMAELTLGTGGILNRFDYITTLNGSSIVNDKSIVNSATTIYWYDFDKNEICMLSNEVAPLSKLKNVQSYLNTLPRAAKTNAVSFYDKKYNEVWFRIYDKSLIYNEQLSVFTSFYTHNPNWFFPFSDKLVTIKNNNMYYLHNLYEVTDDDESREARVAKIQFVVNKDISNTKVFDNVMFSADLMDNENDIPQIIKEVTFKTKTQETNPIDYLNIEIREDNYRFPISREKVSDEPLNQLTSQSYLGRMRGKYLICDYTFDCNSNREFKLPYIKTTYRHSML